MKAIKFLSFLLLLSLFVTCSDNDQKSSKWQKLTSFPGTGKQFAAATQGTQAFVFFGKLGYEKYSSEVWKYDSETNKWSGLNSYEGQGRSRSTAIIIDNTAYIVGGEKLSDDGIGGKEEQLTDEVLKYNITTDSWENLSPFPGGPTSGGIVIQVDEEVFYGLGDYRGGDNANSVWKYVPATDDWIRLADFPGTLPNQYDCCNGHSTQESRLTNFAYNKSIFVITGARENEPEMWEYKIESNVWAQLTDLTFKSEDAERLFSVRAGSGSYVHKNKCYHLQGTRLNLDIVGNLIFEFDPLTHEYEILDGPNPAIGAVGFLIYSEDEIIIGSDYSTYGDKGYQLWKFKL